LNDNQFAAIIYFVAVDEFNVRSTEDEKDRTKLAISRRVFADICNNNYIEHSIPIVILLNRKDLFHKRLARDEGWEDFKRVFPNYKGQRKDSECLDYIGDSFLNVLDSDQQSRNITIHHTCALDTEAMNVVWSAIRDALLEKLLSKAGYM